jgi:carbon storage regulator
MLVIRRRPGESLLIGEEIEIEILDCGHSQVKLGIRAPKEVTILRKEIRVASEQNRLAAREFPDDAVSRLHAIFDPKRSNTLH